MINLTQDQDPQNLFTSGHKDFVRYSCRDDKFKRKVHDRITKVKRKGDFNEPEWTREHLLGPTVSLHPEFVSYTYHLEGCSRKLLNYIIFFELDSRNNCFKWNPQVIKRFHEYCLIFNDRYTDGVVKQALKNLVRYNLLVNKTRGLYMVNPNAAGSINEASRRELINEYTHILRDKGKDPFLHFLPVYNNRLIA